MTRPAAGYDAAFRDALLRLDQAACDFAVIANNTSHTRLHSIRRGVTLPLISILEETAKATPMAGATQTLVLGTSVTMRSDDYRHALQALRIPSNDRLPDEAIDGLQHLIDTEFEQRGSALGRSCLVRRCRRDAPRGEDAAVILACTELPLALPEHGDAQAFRSDGFTVVNTTAVHARAALSRSLGLAAA